MVADTQANQDQVEFWNSDVGLRWVEYEAAMDRLMAPVLQGVLDRAGLRDGERVLDIGCGTGASTLEAARLVGAAGMVDGFDISRPMLSRAAERAANEGVAQARFVLADVQTHAFETGMHDAMISRFGVMFFADPVAAFANMATALRPGGRMVFAAWSAMPKNPFFAMGVNAAVAQLGSPPPAPPSTAGPMAFADIGMVSDLLDQAGMTEIRGEEVGLHLTPPGSPLEVAELTTKMGPVSRLLREMGGTTADAEAIKAEIAGKLAEMNGPEGLRIPATINFFSAMRR